MSNIILFWYDLPFLIKTFAIVTIFCLYIILCIQIYSYLETLKLKRQVKKEQVARQKYVASINTLINAIIEGESCNQNSYQEMGELLRKNKYFEIVFIKEFVKSIKKYSDPTNNMSYVTRKKLIDYAKEINLYKIVLKLENTFGIYNTLALLSIIRDDNSLFFIEKNEKNFRNSKNLYLGYYVMLGYARLGCLDKFRNLFDYILNQREISSDEMYLGLLKNFEGSVIEWQNESLVRGNLNHKIIALQYFMQLGSNNFVSFSYDELDRLMSKKEYVDTEYVYFVYLTRYLEKCDNNYKEEQLVDKLNKNGKYVFVSILESLS